MRQSEITDLHLKVLSWVEDLRLPRGSYGIYKMSRSTDDSPFASCFACFIRHILNDLENLSENQQCEWLDYFLSFQDARTGLFVDNEIHQRGLRDNHDARYVTWQLTTFCISAINVLGGELKHPLRVLEEEDLLSRDGIYRWLRRLNWRNPWGSGNMAMFLGILLIKNYEMDPNKKTRESVDAFFDWHDSHQNPKTGFWGEGRMSEYHPGLFGAYHQYLLYFFQNRELKYRDVTIKKALSFQNIDGLFAPQMGGGGCEDLDVIDTLVNLYFRTNYKRKEIEIALRKAYNAIKSLWNEDGGFIWGFRKFYGLSTGLRLLFDLGNYSDWYEWYFINRRFWREQLTVKQPRHSPGWTKKAIPVDESDLFSTWFRLLAIAFISYVLTDISESKINWNFLSSPGLGWFDKDIVRRGLDYK